MTVEVVEREETTKQTNRFKAHMDWVRRDVDAVVSQNIDLYKAGKESDYSIARDIYKNLETHGLLPGKVAASGLIDLVSETIDLCRRLRIKEPFPLVEIIVAKLLTSRFIPLHTVINSSFMLNNGKILAA